MKRRDLLKFGATAAAAPAGLAAQNRVASAPAWKPGLFDDHQNETVIVLSELIVPTTDTPGGKAALVNRHLDRYLHDGPAEDQQAFMEGLAWLDGFAIRTHAKPFVGCSPEQQIAMLQSVDTSQDAALKPGQRLFQILKHQIVRTYYSTEIGFKEMNKGGPVPGTFACKHGEHA